MFINKSATTFFPIKSLLIITKYLKGDGKTLP